MIMIPHKIHYCWFGKNPLPDSAKKCIQSWEKFFPEYEIIEWNEDNYDINKILYIKQAYDAKKYAFVSDYARFDILYHQGGIYFDTDVEVIKSFDDILEKGSFMGCEIDGLIHSKTDCVSESTPQIFVAPGLGMAAVAGLDIYREILDFYGTQKFIMDNGKINSETVVSYTTKILLKYGLKDIKGIQEIGGITIFPEEYFNPLNSLTGKLDLTENTHSIHWYTMSWLSLNQRIKTKITRVCRRVLGVNCFSFLKNK